MKKMICCLFVLIMVSGCASTPTKAPVVEQVNSTQVLVDQGYAYLKAGKLNQAVEEFDLAIEQCQKLMTGEKQVYTARTPIESLSYMAIAATAKKSAEVLDTSCSDAYYLKGYASLDFGKIDEAETYLKRAVSMAPNNAMYLSELGHVYQVKREWNNALAHFTEAESAAETYSPAQIKINELCRAKRGVGFNLIELGKLDDAERKFREALAYDAKDKVALNEIEYIKELRKAKTQ
jgi:tetratricopeptide (TPR) repeat protein